MPRSAETWPTPHTFTTNATYTVLRPAPRTIFEGHTDGTLTMDKFTRIPSVVTLDTRCGACVSFLPAFP